LDVIRSFLSILRHSELGHSFIIQLISLENWADCHENLCHKCILGQECRVKFWKSRIRTPDADSASMDPFSKKKFMTNLWKTY